MPYELRHFAEALLMPPGHSVVLWLMAAWWMLRGRPMAASVATVVGMLSVVVFSLPVTAGALLRTLQPEPVTVAEVRAWHPEAIVVLCGGQREYAPEFGEGAGTVNARSLLRARFGAWLHRELGVPLLLSGGRVGDEDSAEADLMARVLREEFGVEVRWIEDRSRNTAENARFSAAILRADGVTRVALVTSATHMARSVAVFEGAGLTVLPSPTAFDTGVESDLGVSDWLPRAASLEASTRALHEMLGALWYRLRGSS